MQAKVVFVYKQDGEVNSETNETERERKTLEFSIGYDNNASGSTTATTVNLLENKFSFENNPGGNLWLKGGRTAVYTTIDLFGEDADNNGKADELETIIQNDWLINQAILTLFVDRGRAGSDTLTDRKSTRLNSSHVRISYAVFCLKKKKRPANIIEASLAAVLLTYSREVDVLTPALARGPALVAALCARTDTTSSRLLSSGAAVIG